ncbi:Dihydropteridine reductase-like Protein [Tribolium castaneum]|uniref:Dihydropteridine reductase n=1 Tax=Tribolium castaneum TaxID=7070 RepID=D6W812_TRICA|nr:Dihydropteridine reductase-like Protein [Tribolium castaneum]
MSQAGRVVVYGGRGALGSKCISALKAKNFWVGSIDLNENSEADLNIVLEKDSDLMQQETTVLESIKTALSGAKLDAVICVAGGWAGGNAAKDLVKNSDLMWRQSVWSSLISASIAAQHLKEGGVVTLTGAKAALEGTPGMIGYGMAKSAVHHLTKSLAGPKSGLPENSLVVAILPITLDTPMNRKWMPKPTSPPGPPWSSSQSFSLNGLRGKTGRRMEVCCNW